MYNGNESTGGALAATGLLTGIWIPVWLSAAFVLGGLTVFLVMAWKKRGNRG